MIRNKSLDLIKIIAILTMVVDHCRFIFPNIQMQLISIGRWAFILFSVAIAYNCFTAIRLGKINTIKNYFKNLSLFVFLSEIPYQFMVGTSEVFNVMLTLLLGLCSIFFFEYIKGSLVKIFILISFFFIIFMMDNRIEYGLFGVALIFVSYLISKYNFKYKILLFPIFLFFALACNLQYYSPIIKVMGIINIYTFPLILSITSASIFSFIVLYVKRVNFYVPTIKKWAYWFYPIHMILIGIIFRLMN